MNRAPPPIPTRSTPCSACGEATEPGYVRDESYVQHVVGTWVSGPIHKGWFGTVKSRDLPTYLIQGVRCTACGKLDLYARVRRD